MKSIDEWINEFKTYPRSVQISSWISMLNDAKKAYLEYFSKIEYCSRERSDKMTGGISAFTQALLMDALTERIGVIFKNCEGYALNGTYRLVSTNVIIDSNMVDEILDKFIQIKEK